MISVIIGSIAHLAGLAFLVVFGVALVSGLYEVGRKRIQP